MYSCIQQFRYTRGDSIILPTLVFKCYNGSFDCTIEIMLVTHYQIKLNIVKDIQSSSLLQKKVVIFFLIHPVFNKTTSVVFIVYKYTVQYNI